MQNSLDYLTLSSLTPYYDTHPELKPIVDLKSPYEKYKLLSKIYPYNSTLIYNLNKAFGLYKNMDKEETIKGWVPFNSVWHEKLGTIDSLGVGTPLDSTCIKSYISTIKYCKENNIHLYVVISPYFKQLRNITSYDAVAKQIAEKNNVPFFYMINDPTILSDNKYFSEPIHLNSDGARVFTRELINKIKSYEAKSSQPVLAGVHTPEKLVSR